jgi:hypothetical protein
LASINFTFIFWWFIYIKSYLDLWHKQFTKSDRAPNLVSRLWQCAARSGPFNLLGGERYGAVVECWLAW